MNNTDPAVRRAQRAVNQAAVDAATARFALRRATAARQVSSTQLDYARRNSSPAAVQSAERADRAAADAVTAATNTVRRADAAIQLARTQLAAAESAAQANSRPLGGRFRFEEALNGGAGSAYLSFWGFDFYDYDDDVYDFDESRGFRLRSARLIVDTTAATTAAASEFARAALLSAVNKAVGAAAVAAVAAAPTAESAVATAEDANAILVALDLLDSSETKISAGVDELSAAALKRAGTAPMTGALDLADHAATAVASLASHPAGAQSACTVQRLERRLNNLVAAVRASAADLSALKVPALAAADPALVGS